MNKAIVLFIFIIIGAGVFASDPFTSGKNAAGTLKDRIVSNDVNIESCEYSADEDMLSVRMISESDKEVISANDITMLRKMCNTVRYDLIGSGAVSETVKYNEVLINSNGCTLIDNDISLTGMTNYELMKNIGNESADKGLYEKLSAVSSSELNTSFSYDPLVGNTLIIEMNCGEETDYPLINKEIADIVDEIGEYNKSDFSVQQVRLSAERNEDEIFLMEADLVYRDFLWWQIPENEESWTEY